MRRILILIYCCLPTLSMGSPCDNTTIEIFNQTHTAFRLIDKDVYGNTLINNLAINELIKPNQKQNLRVYSGIGTKGSASGILTFVAIEETSSYSNTKFIALDIQLHHHWLHCDIDVNVRNANYHQFDAYVLPGYHHNTKVFIIG